MFAIQFVIVDKTNKVLILINNNIYKCLNNLTHSLKVLSGMVVNSKCLRAHRNKILLAHSSEPKWNIKLHIERDLLYSHIRSSCL